MRNPLVLDPNCMYCGRRFSRQNVSRHEQACGRGLGSRYQILAIRGFGINPGLTSRGGANGRVAPTVWFVLDKDYMDQVVGIFDNAPGHTSDWRREQAEKLCRELNAEQVAA